MDEERYGPVRIIRGPKNGKAPYSHSFLVGDSGFLIDSGAGLDELKKLKERGRARTIINSHYHPDHITNNTRLNLPVWIHEADAPALRSFDAFSKMTGVWGQPFEHKWRRNVAEWLDFREYEPERTFKDGNILDLGGIKMDVIHTPGHTPGHCCFRFPDEKIMMVFDYDLDKWGPWYGNATSDLPGFVESGRMIEKSDAEIFITSHGAAVYRRDEYIHELKKYMARIDERDEAILGRLKEPATLDDLALAGIFYWNIEKLDRLFKTFERRMVSVHLERLISTGRVALEDGKYREK
jgi:hydroxyacylglutathione hydrolase